MGKKTCKIGDITVGHGMPPFVIAEISGNHNGSLDRALKLIDVAQESGAHAVKFQTYTPESLTLNTNKSDFTLTGGTWKGQNLFKLYEKAQTPTDWFPRLFEHARKKKILAFSSVFDLNSVDYLESLNVPAYKIASNELSDYRLIEKVAETKKPVIMSTGTSTYTEVGKTLKFAKDCGLENPIILHCVSAYPALAAEANINTIKEIRRKFNVIAGFSDHTLGTAASVAAVALSASVIEKHITLDRKDGGPDSTFSLEPAELKKLCEDCKWAWESLGNIKFGGEANLEKNNIFTRQYWSFEDIKKGDILSDFNVRSIRGPSQSGAVSARDFVKIFGSISLKDIEKNNPIFLSDLDENRK